MSFIAGETKGEAMRRRIAKTAVAGALATAAVIGGVAVSSPASADRSDCTVQHVEGGTYPNVATCPAGAGQFSFRAMATCLSFTPPHHYPAYGSWVRVSGTRTTTSQVSCSITTINFGMEFR
jgi:hypothetical protein